MGRMSARYIGNAIGKPTSWVYMFLEDMGLVVKDKFSDWTLTEAGRDVGGKMSKSNYCPVPTFDFDVIEKMMIDFFNENRKKYE